MNADIKENAIELNSVQSQIISHTEGLIRSFKFSSKPDVPYFKSRLEHMFMMLRKIDVPKTHPTWIDLLGILQVMHQK